MLFLTNTAQADDTRLDALEGAVASHDTYINQHGVAIATIQSELAVVGVFAQSTGTPFAAGEVLDITFDARSNTTWGTVWNQFVCPVTGVYALSYYVIPAVASPAGNANQVWLQVRGAPLQSSAAPPARSDSGSAVVVNLTAGDVVAVRMYNATDAKPGDDRG
jgi:hypothetical protein